MQKYGALDSLSTLKPTPHSAIESSIGWIRISSLDSGIEAPTCSMASSRALVSSAGILARLRNAPALEVLAVSSLLELDRTISLLHLSSAIRARSAACEVASSSREVITSGRTLALLSRPYSCCNVPAFVPNSPNFNAISAYFVK